ncbi:MAG: Thymidylate synthase [Candidatus Uhrbacteria bacterium GW2011_GWF2_41_430]|nr:MAG: Thymidylate synthase [Candidatus Uhrbacteria bacterium GW2011_GWF2_41_430]
MTTFDRVFRDAIAKIMFEGEEIFSERTGISTRAVPGLTYELYPAQGFPLLTLRKIPVQLFVSEAVWMITGDKNIAFMQRFTKIWDAFAEEDNTMECAYGYRWRHHFGRFEDRAIFASRCCYDVGSSRRWTYGPEKEKCTLSIFFYS